jgi:hypothetical protein
VAEIRTVAVANRYLWERFIPDYNTTFAHAPADSTSAFVPVGRHDLAQILCHEEDRVVLQIDKQRGRRSCAGLRVVRASPSPLASIWCGGARGAWHAAPPRAGLCRPGWGIPR